MKKKLFIDCDPGIDDFAAILAALKLPDTEVVGLASVAGNLPVETTTENIGKTLELAGRGEIPYAKGAEKPLNRTPVTAAEVHGDGGLGSLQLPTPAVRPVEENAVSFLCRCAKEYAGELVVLAIGPLTNLALALTAHPVLAGQIREIVLMGGAFAHGNVTPKAEFNIYADPHAAHVVFESGIPLTMVGLDATMAVALDEDECRALCPDTPAGRAVATIMKDNRQYNEKFGLGRVTYLHDLTGLACVVAPDAFRLEEYRVDIELKGSLTLGQTVCDVDNLLKKAPNTRVAMGVNEARYRAVLSELLGRI